jgi:hypothetical protein
LENNNQKQKKDYSGAVIILLLLSFSWGVPSLIRGDGFIKGITENIGALLVLLVVGIIVILALKGFKD